MGIDFLIHICTFTSEYLKLGKYYFNWSYYSGSRQRKV